MIPKKFPVVGFEPWNSDVGNQSTYWATAMSLLIYVPKFLVMSYFRTALPIWVQSRCYLFQTDLPIVFVRFNVFPFHVLIRDRSMGCCQCDYSIKLHEFVIMAHLWQWISTQNVEYSINYDQIGSRKLRTKNCNGTGPGFVIKLFWQLMQTLLLECSPGPYKPMSRDASSYEFKDWYYADNTHTGLCRFLQANVLLGRCQSLKRFY